MITSLLSSLLQPRRAAHVTALVGLAGLAAFSSARASVPSLAPDTVVTGDTFSIELIGYNTTTPSGDFYAIQSSLNPTFGTTQTFANDALGGQTLTVFSSEATIGGKLTDTITISVPTNFIPSGTTDNNGNVVNALQFSIGNNLGGTNTLDYTSSIAGATFSGSGTYTGQGGGTVSFANVQNPVLTNSGKSLSNFEYVQVFNGGTTPSAISPYAFNSFTFTVAVPEPSTYATVLLGVVGLCWLTVARRRARA